MDVAVFTAAKEILLQAKSSSRLHELLNIADERAQEKEVARSVLKCAYIHDS